VYSVAQLTERVPRRLKERIGLMLMKMEWMSGSQGAVGSGERQSSSSIRAVSALTMSSYTP
jgi:hypothetical protein